MLELSTANTIKIAPLASRVNRGVRQAQGLAASIRRTYGMCAVQRRQLPAFKTPFLAHATASITILPVQDGSAVCYAPPAFRRLTDIAPA